MSCEELVCGTGGWTGPKPGDPDNNSVLSATPAFGGIDVSWSYPATNPHAVAHTLLYRGVIPNFNAAIQIAVVAGNTFYDKVATGTVYYYWIRIISVNGTEADPIGPASASARATIEQTIIDLSGKINESYLAGSLRSEIGRIASTYSELQAEIAGRVSADSALGRAMSNLQAGIEFSIGLIQEEVTIRKSGQDALVNQLELVVAANASNLAAITTEKNARVTADTAFATRIGKVEVTNTANGAAIKNIEVAKIGYSALQNDTRPFDGDGTTVIYPASTYPAIDFPFYANSRYRIIDQIGVDNWNAKNTGTTVQWLQGLPLATAVKQVGVTGPNGGFASIEQSFTTQSLLNSVLRAEYYAKVQVDSGGNKLIGGFGLYADSQNKEVVAGFDVDQFWIGKLGKTGDKKVFPFIVQDNEVFINDAVINKLTFNKLRSENGEFLVENGKLKAKFISVERLTGGAWNAVPYWHWPAQGTGFYLGPEGLLMGNVNTGKYCAINTDGNFYLPGLKVENGLMTLDALNVVDTLSIRDQAVTVPVGLAGNGGATNVTPGSQIQFLQYHFTSDKAPTRLLINMIWQAMNAGTAGNVDVDVRIDGVSRVYWRSSGLAGYVTSHSLGGLVNLPQRAEPYRITFHAMNSWHQGSWDIQAWSVTMLGVMK